MRLQPTALLKTLTGKTVVALLVVTSGVGAAAAAGAEVPLLTPIEAADDGEPAEEPGDDGDSDDGAEAADEAADDAPSQFATEPSALRPTSDDEDDDQSDDQDEDGAGDDEEDAAGLEVEDDEDDEGDEGDHPDNHGEVVSTFTRDNPLELEGCEKGQATAAVARGDVDPESATLQEDLTPYLAKCDHDLESEDVTAAEVEATETESEIDWKTLRDEGRETVHLAQQTFVEACGDDEGDDGGEDGGEATDEGATEEAVLDADEAPMTDDCRALLAAAKEAREAWKLEWKTARDEAKGRVLSPPAESGDAEPPATGKPENTGKPEKTGKPERTGKPEQTGKPEKTGKP